MKTFYISVIALALMTSCTTIVVSTKPTSKKTAPVANKNGKVPPGQMKKATGSQSAKPYAPGQQKKK